MSTLNPTLVLGIVFALVLIIAAFKFNDKFSATISALGAKLRLTGKGRDVTKAISRGGGIRGNWLIGKVRAATQGNAGIENTKAIGDIDLKATDVGSGSSDPASPREGRKR